MKSLPGQECGTKDVKNNEICNEVHVEEEEDLVPIPPDGGWGWVVMICSLLNNFIVDGIPNAFSYLLYEFIDHYEASHSEGAWVGSLLAGVYLCTGPIAGGLINRYGCRSVCILGSGIASLAFFVSRFSPNITVLAVLYGVFGGIGFGFIYLPSIVSVSYYFEKRRALATGIAVCGSGIGAMAFGPIMQSLLEVLGWQNTLTILSGLILQCAIFGCLMRPLEPLSRKKNSDHSAALDCEKETRMSLLNNYTSSMQGMVMDYVKQEKIKKVDKENEAKFCQSTPCFSIVNKSENLLEKRKRLNSSGQICNEHCNNVQTTDFKRPLYRKDIFYSGSIYNLNQVQNKEIKKTEKKNSGTMGSFIRSMTLIPGLDDDCNSNLDDDCIRDIPLLNHLTKSFRVVLGRMTNLRLFKNSSYTIIWFANLIGMMGFYVPNVFMVGYAQELNISSHSIKWLFLTFGLTNTFGRVFFGWLVGIDKRMSPLVINNVTLMIAGVCVMIIPQCRDYITLMIAFGAYGLFVAPWIAMTSLILCDLVGIDALTNAFGLLTVSRGIACSIGAPVAGSFYSESSGYKVPFVIGGAVLCFCSLLHMILHLPRYSKQMQAQRKELKSKSLASLNLDTTNSPDFMEDNHKSVEDHKSEKPSPNFFEVPV